MLEGNLIDIAIWAGSVFLALVIFAITITRLYRLANMELGVGSTAYGVARVVW